MEGARLINGVKFGDIHSDDLSLILASKDLGRPRTKTSKVEVPGSSVTLDFTEAFGEINYSNRAISLAFLCLEPWDDQFQLQTDVRNALHGKRMNIYFDEDDSVYFTGRVSVESWSFDRGAGRVQISVDADPWRYDSAVKTLSATNASNKELTFVNDGRKTVVPKISCTAAATVTWYTGDYPNYTTHTVTLSAGDDQVIPQFTRKAGTTHVYVTTTGTITFSWQEANL